MGIYGPKHVKVPSDAKYPGPPPYPILNTPETILDVSDLVFIDPVGTDPKSGKTAISEFYAMATRGGTTLEQMGPTHIADKSAAFAFKVHVQGIKSEDKAIDVDLPTGSMVIDVIDVFDFNDDGKISQMRAYWGPYNISQ